MWISCKVLVDAGVVPPYSCCGSCHANAEDGYDWEMCGLYEKEVLETGDFYKLVGSVCCSVRNKFELPDARIAELVQKPESQAEQAGNE